MPTIQDVARTAAVSTATVSRVLTRPERVAEDTRARVLSAVEALGYEPNLAARNLRRLKSERLLVMVPDISNPFFSAVIRGAEEAAQEAGYSVLLGDTRHDPEREEQYAAMLRRREADGLLFLGHRLPATLAELVTREGPRAPVVNACEFSPELPVCSVHIDNAAAAGEAVAHLYELGHRRVGVITGPLESPLSRDRLSGAQAVAKAWGRAGTLDVRVGDFSIDSGLEETARLLDGPEPPSAIFCFSDETAMGALEAIRRHGLDCPGDVSLVGFDDIRYAAYLRPALTTVGQPMTDLGREAVRLLIDKLERRADRHVSRVLPHRLVVRDSTGPARA